MFKNTPRVCCTAAVLLSLAACQDMPKYKKSSGSFDEWKAYEGKDFSPKGGIVTAVDVAGSTVTITKGTTNTVYPVTPETRIMHEGADVTLAQLPLNHAIKYTLSGDKKRLLTIWYGEHMSSPQHVSVEKPRNTLY